MVDGLFKLLDRINKLGTGLSGIPESITVPREKTETGVKRLT